MNTSGNVRIQLATQSGPVVKEFSSGAAFYVTQREVSAEVDLTRPIVAVEVDRYVWHDTVAHNRLISSRRGNQVTTQEAQLWVDGEVVGQRVVHTSTSLGPVAPVATVVAARPENAVSGEVQLVAERVGGSSHWCETKERVSGQAQAEVQSFVSRSRSTSKCARSDSSSQNSSECGRFHQGVCLLHSSIVVVCCC